METLASFYSFFLLYAPPPTFIVILFCSLSLKLLEGRESVCCVHCWILSQESDTKTSVFSLLRTGCRHLCICPNQKQIRSLSASYPFPPLTYVQNIYWSCQCFSIKVTKGSDSQTFFIITTAEIFHIFFCNSPPAHEIVILMIAYLFM